MKNPLHQAEAILGHLTPIDIDAAYMIAHALGHHETDILLLDRNSITNVKQIYSDTAPGIPASRFRIRFHGGPIGKGTWHSGTLYSFILDCIAVKIQMEGFEKVRELLRIKQTPGSM
jgi:hypothetical protein